MTSINALRIVDQIGSLDHDGALYMAAWLHGYQVRRAEELLKKQQAAKPTEDRKEQ